MHLIYVGEKIMKKIAVKLAPIMLALMFSMMLITTAFAAFPISNVTMYVEDGANSYFSTTLTGIPPGEEISDGTYLGWCVETDRTLDRLKQLSVILYSSLNPPSSLAGEAWDKVNYILNHKQGGRIDIQAAIWYFIKLDPDWLTPGYYAYDPYGDNRYGGNPPSTETQYMVNDAIANGDGYTPGPGDVLAIICVPEDECQQISIVELKIPRYCYETAYAKVQNPTSNKYAVNFIPTFSNWGWTNRLPEYGEYTFDLWAGAGQCDTSKGTLVGTVTITYNASGLSWTVNLNPGITLEEVHVYAGSNQFPMVKQGKKLVQSVAPGLYTINLPTNGEPIWVIWHAVVGIPC